MLNPLDQRDERDDAMLRGRIRWTACAGAGCVYALMVFAIGFALGAFRVLLFLPRWGSTAAVLLELPVILSASWKLSRWSAERHGLLTDTSAALLMGAIAFAVLQLAELATSVFFFHRTVWEHLAHFRSVPGVIGLAGQLCFAGFPFVQAVNERRASRG